MVRVRMIATVAFSGGTPVRTSRHCSRRFARIASARVQAFLAADLIVHWCTRCGVLRWKGTVPLWPEQERDLRHREPQSAGRAVFA
jgi:hypothetical protein